MGGRPASAGHHYIVANIYQNIIIVSSNGIEWRWRQDLVLVFMPRYVEGDRLKDVLVLEVRPVNYLVVRGV